MNNPEMRLRTMKRNGFTWHHYWSAILFRFYNNEEICLLRRKRGISRVKFLLAIPCLMNSYRLKFWYDVHRSIILCRLCTRYYIICLLFVDFLYLSFEQQRERLGCIFYICHSGACIMKWSPYLSFITARRVNWSSV